MFNRLCKPLLSNSFFLFGARGTGKTSLLKVLLPPSEDVYWVDLLDDGIYQELLARPQRFVERIPTHFGNAHWVVADEIQRLPQLLNYVHKLIEERKIKFALTGSSARKLKRGGANLLAGRAFLNSLHPLTSEELQKEFDLESILNWGSLPAVINLGTDLDRKEYLKAYTGTYLRQEIKEEQIVRRLDPFARFLEVSAQHNGKVLNFSKIARDSLTEVKSVQRYFDILVDTFLGFYLEPYHKSVRKVQTTKAKFYFFDSGVKRSLENTLSSPLTPGTYAFGDAFEHFFILECLRLRDYFRSDDRFYYICTKDDLEIDLIVEKSKKEVWAIEIKSSDRVDEVEILKKKKLADDLKVSRFLVASRESQTRMKQGVEICHWQTVLQELFA